MDIPEDYKFKVMPFKYQMDGIKYGLDHDKWLLADEMGMGKSKTVIEIANIRQVKHCLIICCDNGLKWNWMKEVHKHSDEGCFILGQKETKKGLVIKNNPQRLEHLNNIQQLPRFIITNIETLKYRIPTGERVERKIKGKLKSGDRYQYPISEKIQQLCKSKEIDMIVIDEFHRVRNENTEQSKQILKIHSLIQIAITGTPIMNNPMDIFMSLKWLGYEDRNFWGFKHRYCRLGGYTGNDIIGYKNLEELSKALSSIMLRRLKSEELDLPDKLFVDEYVEMGTKQAAIYNKIKNNLLEQPNEIKRAANPLAKFVRLRQATGYTGIVSADIKVSAKFDRMEDIVDAVIEEGKKVVLFSNWVQIVAPAYERLSQKHKGVMVTGQLKDSIRQHNVDQFQIDDKIRFIIGTIDSMGRGYNLFSGSVVIFIDEPWNMETKRQAIDRCHRIGSTSNITIYTLICVGTIDERISGLVKAKGAISNILIDNNNLQNKDDLINYLLS